MYKNNLSPVSYSITKHVSSHLAEAFAWKRDMLKHKYSLVVTQRRFWITRSFMDNDRTLILSSVGVFVSSPYVNEPVMKGHLLWRDTCYEGTPAMKGHLLWRDTCHEGTPVMKGHLLWRDTFSEILRCPWRQVWMHSVYHILQIRRPWFSVKYVLDRGTSFTNLIWRMDVSVGCIYSWVAFSVYLGSYFETKL